MVEKDQLGEVVVLRMAHGKVNAMDIELCHAVRAAFEAEKTAKSGAIVLTGSGSVFSAGVDLFRLLNEDKSHTAAFLKAFAAMLYEVLHSPKPTVAAINGHAIAGGCVLACACDVRLMANSGGKIGLPELVVGVAFPKLAIRIVQNAIPMQLLSHLIYSGALWSAEEAQKNQLVTAAVAPDNLLEQAKNRAQQLASLAPKAFSRTKQAIQSGVTIDATVEQDVIDLWMADETRECIRTYMESTVKKK